MLYGGITGNPLIENILIFQKFAHYKGEEMYQVLKDESPQTVAIILARLGASKAKEVLAFYTAEEKKDILFRIAQGTHVASEILNTIAKALHQKIRIFDETKGEKIGGSEKMAQILSHMKGDAGKNILSELARKDLGLVDQIRDKMVTFSDIAKTNDRGLRTVLVEIDNHLLALALKKTDEAVKEKIFKNISKNRLAILRDEIATLGPRKVSEIETAQSEVVAILRKFEDKGMITFDEDKEKWV